MSGYLSNRYALYSTCPKCGWSGRDWGFKYRNLCKKCHAQWRKEKAKEKLEDKLPNRNIELDKNVIVTENVYKRLFHQAKHQIGIVSLRKRFRLIYPIIFFIAMWLSYYLNEYMKHITYKDLSAVIKILVYFVAIAVCCIFEHHLHCIIAKETINLAHKRQQNIEEQKSFYNSPEWKTLRSEVIEDCSYRCASCGRKISDPYNLTVDHIKPRSKFPDLALDKSNLQILCRSCNSSKGANYNELN